MIENFKLKVFRVVADTLNFRRAADELHPTQPAVAAQIKSLKESLGALLFFDRILQRLLWSPDANKPIRSSGGRPASFRFDIRRFGTYCAGFLSG